MNYRVRRQGEDLGVFPLEELRRRYEARELAGMTLWQFRQLLASRQIGPHYGIEEYQEDLETLRNLGCRIPYGIAGIGS